MKKILGMLSILFPTSLFAFMCMEILLRYPCNHGAGFYCYLYPVCGLIVLSGTYGFFLRGSKGGFILSFICLILILVSDLFNVYVDYDVWTHRGMPDWGHYGTVEAFGQDVEAVPPTR